MKNSKRIHLWLGVLVFVLLSTGCKPSHPEPTNAEADDELGLSVQVLNYMDEGLGVVYVDGVWAGGMSSHAGGTKIAGSIGLPAKWRPGLTVEVEWRDTPLWEKDPNALYKATIPVERYDTIHSGFLWLAFFPGNKVRAIPSSTSPGFPGFPDGLKYPADVCQADPACAAKFYSAPDSHSGQEHKNG